MENNFNLILRKFDDLVEKSNNLEAGIDIILRKSQFNQELIDVLSDVQEIIDLENDIKGNLNHKQQIVMQEYQETKHIVESVTSKIFFLLTEIENISNRPALSEISSPAPRLFDEHHRPGAQEVFSQVNTPRLTIEQYAKSPLIKKKSRAQLQFSDFEEVTITKDEFDKVPSYIRGRMTLGELQEFLDTIVMKCFNFKYELLYKSRSVLKQSEFQLQNQFKQQERYFENQHFITIGDLSRLRKIDRKDESKIQCLRHLKIIKEERKNSAVCYLWSR